MARCGNYAEYDTFLGKPDGWEGCTRPSGHPGICRDVSAELTDEAMNATVAAMLISREGFERYVRMQASGRFNMFTESRPAALAAGLSRTEYGRIQKWYSNLQALYPDVTVEAYA